jgi:hypothetical protein
LAIAKVAYYENTIQILDALEHIRLRISMYIGRLGDGSNPMDGICGREESSKLVPSESFVRSVGIRGLALTSIAFVDYHSAEYVPGARGETWR